MSTQTASWSRLEILLNETTVKKPSITPKSACKLDDPSQPRLWKCLRSKTKAFPNLNPMTATNFSTKCEETPNSAIGKVNMNAINFQIRSNNEVGTRTFVTLKEVQKGSLEELDQYSEISDCRRNLYATNAYCDNIELDTEEDNRGYQAQKYASVGSIKVTPASRGNNGQKRQNFIFCQSLVDNGLVVKRLSPVCGIPDAQIRELYQLKCQDLKIAVFAESEESFLQGTKKKSTDNKLCLHETGFGPKALEKLGQILQGNDKIVQLHLRKSILNGESMRYFARSVAQMPSLVHLELANNAIEPSDFIILFEELAASKTLVSIDLSNYESDRKNRMTVECIEAFKRIAHGNPYLQFVKIVNLMLEDDVIQGLLTALEGSPSLVSLNLSSNSFTGKCLENLPTLVSQTALIKLDLSNNKLKKEGAAFIGKAVQGFRGPGREGLELILENTQLGVDINSIFAAFGRDTNVSKMNFSHNVLSNMEIIRIQNALAVNTKLTELNLSNCKIGEIVGRLLSLGLQKNKSLQNLILLNNDLGDGIGAQIIYSLIQNHSFKFLDMTQNHLASESAKALQELIKKNPGVNKYNLNLNKFNEKEGYLLQEALYFNSKIIQFNLHHNPVKYNTIETIERIIKDNQRKMRFQSVPKLKDEVARKRGFIQDEKYAIGEAVEMEKVKGDVKRDVERFQETLKTLKDRPESPTMKKNEKVLVKLGKDIRVQAKEYYETVLKTRDFTDEACLEMECYKKELEVIETQMKQVMQKIEVKKRDTEDMKKKYEPEIKRLKFEISKLNDENNFLEMYNDTINQKIKKEKKKMSISNQAPIPKISDMFLATSELARHKKKHGEPEKTQESKSRIVGQDSHSQISEDPKVIKEYNFAVQNQQLRINKMNKGNENLNVKQRKKKNSSKSETPDQENIKERIKAKIKSLIKEDNGHGHVGLILGQITDN